MSVVSSGGISAGAGGGGMAGGMAMSHHVGAGAQLAQPNAGPQAEIPSGTAGAAAAPPSSAAALGVDLVDKQQVISLKQVRDVSHMPLVAIDLYANEPHIASFPPKEEANASDKPPSTRTVGKFKTKVALQANETAHKALRKWLLKTKSYSEVRSDILAPIANGDQDGQQQVVIDSPQNWLGLRRHQDAPQFLQDSIQIDSESEGTKASVISEESLKAVGTMVANSTLDGKIPQNDDFDRAVFKVRLHPEKKAHTILPEEALQILMHQARHHVALSDRTAAAAENKSKDKKSKGKNGEGEDGEDDDEEEIEEYPCCIAVPAPYCNDAAMEAMLEATDGRGVLLQRSTCALAGALIPGSAVKPNPVLEHIQSAREAIHNEHKRKIIKNPDAVLEDEIVVMLISVTSNTAECTAIQISSPQQQPLCFFGNFRVLASVSYQSNAPMSIVGRCIEELHENLQVIAPEMDDPVCAIAYGSPSEQKEINSIWEKIRTSLEDWEKMRMFFTKSDCVATGTAILGAVSHGRLSVLAQIPGKKRPKAMLAIRVQNVSPVAVGIKMNYFADRGDKWGPIRTIFDFDRRVPAGPHSIDLSAADCAVHRTNEKAGELPDEEFLKLTKSLEGSANIPKREEAALNMRLQVVQKYARDGPWVTVGNPMSPLVDVDRDGNKVACERITLELSLGPTGLISQALTGERESVVQAVKSARNSTLRWWLCVLGAILFFGGFLVKSYWEEHVFERDTIKLLAYYKQVVPGSIQDGDLHNARYLVWKYRGKKDRLWKSLEKKYGEPVLDSYPDVEVKKEATEEEDKEESDGETQEL